MLKLSLTFFVGGVGLGKRGGGSFLMLINNHENINDIFSYGHQAFKYKFHTCTLNSPNQNTIYIMSTGTKLQNFNDISQVNIVFI